ncbi:MAG: alkane 1-monooxygenase [Rhodobacteraceae bacterium]|nr:alkane 1-monooxygenase [Paracoccaceae bacterium]MCY4197244.1 alkane 1-monooxygenase [Paracoccaceae bacterium]
MGRQIDSHNQSPVAATAVGLQLSAANALLYLAPVSVLPLLIVAAHFGSWWIAAPLLFSMLTEPLDNLSGPEERNIDVGKEIDKRLTAYDVVLWVWVVGWPITLLYVLWQILVMKHLAFWESILIATALGYAASIVLVAAHELLHEGSAKRRHVAEFLLCSVGCAQYATDHIYVHHPNVATPRDPASARKGVGFWHYLPRSLAGNLAAGWRVATARLSKRGHSVWHYSNPYWRYAVGTAAWYLLSFALAGAWGILIVAIIHGCATIALRLGDYIEHYGLQRIWLDRGRFERIELHHSWNAVGRLSNWLYYNTQRHSDHHARPARVWPLLQNHVQDDAPRFPGTYSKMFGLAMSPHRWFATMDPLVDRWRARFYPQIEDWSVYESAAFAARPGDFALISEIHESSPAMHRWIERDPELLANLRSREFVEVTLPDDLGLPSEVADVARKGLARFFWTREFGVVAMKEQIADAAVRDIEAKVESVRDWTNNNVFQIAAHAMRGNLQSLESARAMSNIAEAAIASLLASVIDGPGSPYVKKNGSGIAVLLGEAAREEATPGCELELLFIYTSGSAADQNSLCHLFRKELQEWLRGNLLFSIPRHGVKSWECHSLDNLSGFCQAYLAHEVTRFGPPRCVFSWGGEDAAETKFAVAWQDAINGHLPAVTNALAQHHEHKSDTAGPRRSFFLNDILLELERESDFLRCFLYFSDPRGAYPDPVTAFDTACQRAACDVETSSRLAATATFVRSLRIAERLLVGNESESIPEDSMKQAIMRCCEIENDRSLVECVERVSGHSERDLAELHLDSLFNADRFAPDAT